MPYKQDPNVVATTIRLPRALLERIDEIAKAERRSRNATLIVLLESAATSHP
jgi:predicted transcriptional regulator